MTVGIRRFLFELIADHMDNDCLLCSHTGYEPSLGAYRPLTACAECWVLRRGRLTSCDHIQVAPPRYI